MHNNFSRVYGTIVLVIFGCQSINWLWTVNLWTLNFYSWEGKKWV